MNRKRLPSSFVKCLTSFSFLKNYLSSSLLQRIFLKTIIGTTPMCCENFFSCTRKHDVSCFLNQTVSECPMPSFGISNLWDKAKKRERVRSAHPNCEGDYSLCMWWRAGMPSGKRRATVMEGITFRKKGMDAVAEWFAWVYGVQRIGHNFVLAWTPIHRPFSRCSTVYISIPWRST